MRIDMWHMQSLYRLGSHTTVVRELASHRLDLMGVQEVRYCVLVWKPAGR
jgi:hypothetical protein